MKIVGIVEKVHPSPGWAGAYRYPYCLTLRGDGGEVAEIEVFLDTPPAVGDRFVYRDGDDQTVDGTARVAPPALPDTVDDA